MSMHRIPLTDIEREGLKAHGLGRDIGKPSQLADCFRQGVKWGQDQERSRLHAENEALQSGYDAARLEIESLQSRLIHANEQHRLWFARSQELEVLRCRDMEHALQRVAGVGVRDLANLRKKQTGGTT